MRTLRRSGSGPTFLVALSGGADSTATLALLRYAGYDCVGVHLQFWAEEDSSCADGSCGTPAGSSHGYSLPEDVVNADLRSLPGTARARNKCCDERGLFAARRACARLRVPFYVLDVRDVFRHEVVDRFLDGVRAGDAPNPCASCNEHVKLGFLADVARQLGPDVLVATGHYARLVSAGRRPGTFPAKLAEGLVRDRQRGSAFRPNPGIRQGLRKIFDHELITQNPVVLSERSESKDLAQAKRAPPALEILRLRPAGYAQDDGGCEPSLRLHRAVDETKDQTYFLARVRPETLARVRFPLGGMTKEWVKKLLDSWQFEIPAKESMGLCFFSEERPGPFIRRRLGRGVPGKIFDHSGTEISSHEDVLQTTLGERIRLGGRPEPEFIVSRDLATGEIRTEREAMLGRREVVLREVSGFGDHVSGGAAGGQQPAPAGNSSSSIDGSSTSSVQLRVGAADPAAQGGACPAPTGKNIPPPLGRGLGGGSSVGLSGSPEDGTSPEDPLPNPPPNGEGASAPDLRGLRIQTRYRSAAVAVSAFIALPDGAVRIRTTEPLRLPAPGQLAVFLRGDEVVGSGWITSQVPSK